MCTKAENIILINSNKNYVQNYAYIIFFLHNIYFDKEYVKDEFEISDCINKDLPRVNILSKNYILKPTRS